MSGPFTFSRWKFEPYLALTFFSTSETSLRLSEVLQPTKDFMKSDTLVYVYDSMSMSAKNTIKHSLGTATCIMIETIECSESKGIISIRWGEVME